MIFVTIKLRKHALLRHSRYQFAIISNTLYSEIVKNNTRTSSRPQTCKINNTARANITQRGLHERRRKSFVTSRATESKFILRASESNKHPSTAGEAGRLAAPDTGWLVGFVVLSRPSTVTMQTKFIILFLTVQVLLAEYPSHFEGYVQYTKSCVPLDVWY